MKKFIYLLLLLPLGLLAASCDDDDKTPDVGLQASVSGAVVADNAIYVVQGEPLTIDAITLVNHSGKEGAIGVVAYYFDNVAIGQAIVAPYSLTLETDNMAVGVHTLTAEMPVYVVDYPICYGVFSFNVVVVADAADLPGEPAPATLPGIIKEK